MTPLQSLANPTRFLKLSGNLILPLAIVTGLVLGIGYYMAFFTVPPDFKQGETIRIMYIHVPFAWLSMGIYVLMVIASLGVLVWRHPLADVAAKAAAPIGASFTFICLVTGSFWGKPMWGAWWVWDARLTSMLVFLLIYFGIMSLRNAIDEPNLAARAAALFTLIGSIMLPIIKFSVDWWNTLHQPASVLRLGGSAIHSSMLIPLYITAIGILLLFITFHLIAMRTEIRRRRIRAMRILAAQE